MTNLEITKLCADAMGITGEEWKSQPPKLAVAGPHGLGYFYDPLHNDAQAMALVKRFGLDVIKLSGGWCARRLHYNESSDSLDLNRAICECVAKMQAAKAGK